MTNSTAIMADAVHDLGDCIAIGSAWVLNRMSRKGADEVFTYGYRRLSLFGALINGVVLVMGSLWILLKALPRLFNPVMPAVSGMMGLAILGIAVNGFAAYRLSKGVSLNERVLNWHLLEDVLGWTAVLIVSVTLNFFDWPVLDPLLAVVFTLFILFNVSRNFSATLKLFFQAVPETLTRKINRELMALDGVREIHHEHFWSMDGEHHVYTAHLLLDRELDAREQMELKAVIAGKLAQFNLAHTTIELEFPDEVCRDNLGSPLADNRNVS